MINARWVDRNTIEVPKQAIDPKTGTVGDGLVPIGPEDPAWTDWVTWLASQGQRRPRG